MSTSTNPSEAAKLKAEGNALFQRNAFSAAYKKYTQAIKHDEKNAILHCNRAACSLGLSRFIDAYSDAKQATELDPGYAKAWGRLAAACTGLGKQEDTITSWKRAIAALPLDNLTPAEQKQKDQYTSELAAAVARAKEVKPIKATMSAHIPESDRPWSRAVAMAATMPNTEWNSTVWILAPAYQNWIGAVQAMSMLQSTQTPAGLAYFGRTGVIEQLSNAILEDPRVFVLTSQDFFEKYNQQMIFELTKTRAWASGSSRTVMEEAPKRLASEGWDSVRPALTLTVRGWILRAFIQGNLTGELEAALDFYTSAIEVLRWGRELWKDVPKEDRGAIFQDSFLRGVKCHRLDTFIGAYNSCPGPTSKFPLAEILAGAQDLLDELGSFPEAPSLETGYNYHLSFVRYPLAQGHSLLGFYHQHTARNIRSAKGPASEVSEHFQAAARAYIRSAEIYPVDDEKHAFCLHCAVDALLEARTTTAEELIKVLNRMHDDIPIMNRIWKFSADALFGRDEAFERDMALRDRLLERMQGGSLTADSIVSRDNMP